MIISGVNNWKVIKNTFIFFFHLSLIFTFLVLPVVTISPGSVNMPYNSTVTITCEVQSLTIPTVNWTTNMNVVLPSASLISNHDNNIYTSTLTLEQVTLEYTGEYSCNAENEGGEISAALNLTVYGEEIY